MRKMGPVLTAMTIAGMLFAASAWATMPMQKKAKELGFDAKNCLYCHNEKLPKKTAVTCNDRGQWLVDQKKVRKAKEVDVSWLKDYVEKKGADEQKAK